MSEIELKPCPFCGVRGTIKNTKTMPTYSVVCANDDCESAFTHWHKSEQDAVTEWNTRHDGWISVDERLPDEDVTVICWCNDIVSGWAENLYLMNGDWHHSSDSSSFPCIVTHWMPLPNPPAKKEGVIWVA